MTEETAMLSIPVVDMDGNEIESEEISIKDAQPQEIKR